MKITIMSLVISENHNKELVIRENVNKCRRIKKRSLKEFQILILTSHKKYFATLKNRRNSQRHHRMIVRFQDYLA